MHFPRVTTGGQAAGLGLTLENSWSLGQEQQDMALNKEAAEASRINATAEVRTVVHPAPSRNRAFMEQRMYAPSIDYLLQTGIALKAFYNYNI